MKYYFLLVALVVSAAPLQAEDHLKHAKLEKIDALPCSAFLDRGRFGTLREGVSLEIDVSSTDNSEPIRKLVARMNRCNAEANAAAKIDSLGTH